MGLSAGTGSPVYLRCPIARRDRARSGHRLARTGRWRARRPSGALGVRSLLSEWEIVCSCGYRGWTRHVDVLRTRMEDGTPKPQICGSYHCGAPLGSCRHAVPDDPERYCDWCDSSEHWATDCDERPVEETGR